MPLNHEGGEGGETAALFSASPYVCLAEEGSLALPVFCGC